MNSSGIAIWRGPGCENDGLWLGKCVFYIVNNGLGAICAVFMKNMILGGLGEGFGALWEASGTSLASIWVPGAAPGAAWKFSGLGTDPQSEGIRGGVANVSVAGVQYTCAFQYISISAWYYQEPRTGGY